MEEEMEIRYRSDWIKEAEAYEAALANNPEAPAGWRADMADYATLSRRMADACAPAGQEYANIPTWALANDWGYGTWVMETLNRDFPWGSHQKPPTA